MELRDALDRIGEIHARVVRAELFRGYRALPMAVTGMCAVVGAGIADFAGIYRGGATEPLAFVTHWLVVATVCAAICACDFWLQHRMSTRRELLRRTLPVLAQYLPTVVAGGIVTVALADGDHAKLLPGLWTALHGLGVFSSRPFLPRAVGWVTVYYLAAATVLLVRADEIAFEPWSMGLAFAIGQLLLAAVLHVDLERERRPPA